MVADHSFVADATSLLDDLGGIRLEHVEVHAEAFARETAQLRDRGPRSERSSRQRLYLAVKGRAELPGWVVLVPRDHG